MNQSKLKMALGTKNFLKLLNKIVPGSCSTFRYRNDMVFGHPVKNLQNPPKKKIGSKQKFHRQKK